MKYLIDNNNIIMGILYQEGSSIIDEEVEFGYDKFINGNVIKEDRLLVKTAKEKQKIDFLELHKYDELRRKREKECFSIINRGKLWYDTLTLDKINELNIWYGKWLDVTLSNKIPDKPIWLR